MVRRSQRNFNAKRQNTQDDPFGYYLTIELTIISVLVYLYENI